MAQIVSVSLPNKSSTLHLPHPHPHLTPSSSSSSRLLNLGHQLRCNARFSCLFSDNRNKQEQARKSLESAFGGNKEKFEKWNQEIKKREEAGVGGGGSGGGGWFGWGGRFGWSNGDNFWQEAQQFSLAVLGILVLYLVAAKGDLLLAVIINPLLFALRGARNSITYTMAEMTRRIYPTSNPKIEDMPMETVRVSAKESVVNKWGTD